MTNKELEDSWIRFSIVIVALVKKWPDERVTDHLMN